jgi:hypothetical protein
MVITRSREGNAAHRTERMSHDEHAFPTLRTDVQWACPGDERPADVAERRENNIQECGEKFVHGESSNNKLNKIALGFWSDLAVAIEQNRRRSRLRRGFCD